MKTELVIQVTWNWNSWLIQNLFPCQLQDLDPEYQDVTNTEISKAADLTTLTLEAVSIKEPGPVPSDPTESEKQPLPG